jgi:hypothetical protein
MAIVGGEQKNMAEFVKVSVKDEGNLPMENFQVNGASTSSDEWGNVNYTLDLTWDVPANASPITDYKVYIDQQKGETWYPSANYTSGMPEAERLESYNSVNNWSGSHSSFYWSTFQKQDEDWQPAPEGFDCKIWITAIYATGESKKSNVVEANIYQLANGGTDNVQAVKTVNEQAPIEWFNVGGRQVDKANGRHQLILVRQGNEVRKVLK